jgi:hypothetical protein
MTHVTPGLRFHYGFAQVCQEELLAVKEGFESLSPGHHQGQLKEINAINLNLIISLISKINHLKSRGHQN